MPVYMNSGKIVADGTGGKFEGSTRGPRGPKKSKQSNWSLLLSPEYKKLKATLEWILPTLPNVLPVMTKLLKLKIKQTFDKEIISSLFQVCIQQYNLIQ